MRGSSDAYIRVDEDRGTVTKRDTTNTRDFVVRQGRWLLTRRLTRPDHRGLPHVWSLLPDGYVMEMLHVPELGDLRPPLVVEATADVLAAEVWCEPAVVEVDPIDHAAYVAVLLGETRRYDLLPTSTQVSSEVRWDALHRCLTHGDPIVDNVALRGTDVVLLDPIPATSALPDVLASDVGRLIQSTVGYEAVRYNVALPVGDPRRAAQYAYDVAGMKLTDDEYTACLWFAVVHTLRGVRSAGRRELPATEELNRLVDRLVWEATRWML